MLVLAPAAALAAFCAWLLVVISCRYVSVASIVAAVVLVSFQILLTSAPWSGDQFVVTLFCALAALLVIVRHRANLRRLWSGTENRLKENATMFVFSKILHVLALGLWFGSVAFFTLAGALIFDAFSKEAAKEELLSPETASEAARPLWFSVPDYLKNAPPSDKFPNPLRQEQGSRAAGLAVAPLFPWYYGIQTACALVGAITAVGWCLSGSRGWVHRLRAVLLVLALATLAVGWWLEIEVTAKRGPRNDLTDQVLVEPKPTTQQIQAAEQARAEFGKWHGFSLIQNFATLLLVTGAMALSAQLPSGTEVNHKTAEDSRNKKLMVTN